MVQPCWRAYATAIIMSVVYAACAYSTYRRHVLQDFVPTSIAYAALSVHQMSTTRITSQIGQGRVATLSSSASLMPRDATMTFRLTTTTPVLAKSFTILPSILLSHNLSRFFHTL